MVKIMTGRRSSMSFLKSIHLEGWLTPPLFHCPWLHRIAALPLFSAVRLCLTASSPLEFGGCAARAEGNLPWPLTHVITGNRVLSSLRYVQFTLI